jgi:hypothetical protein
MRLIFYPALRLFISGARAKLLRNFKVEDKDTKIHGNHLSNKGKIGGFVLDTSR